jgi:hypothetical protein
VANLQIIPLGLEEGPEHVVLARGGKLYAAMASGNILRMNPDGSAQEVFANTGVGCSALTSMQKVTWSPLMR